VASHPLIALVASVRRRDLPRSTVPDGKARRDPS
jgi:hypothetical protein